MITLMESMTIVGGYNYDWGNCGDDDLAKQELFPASDLEWLIEENLDPIDGTHAYAYANQASFRLASWGQLPGEEAVPKRAAMSVLMKMLDDQKKLFGINFTAMDTCQSVMYRRAEAIIQPQGDRFIPKKLISHWLVLYDQDRVNPLIYG